MRRRACQVSAGLQLSTAFIAAMVAAAGCGKDDSPSGDHKVFLFGYVYDGATGARLDKATVGTMAITYGDKVLKVQVEDDGRFVTKDPLPTWQDYTVSIKAGGYRDFFSQNRGFDVPPSYTQNDMIATSGSTQTFQFDAYLFPSSLTAPAVTLSVNLPSDVASTTPTTKAAGTARLRPTSSSSIESTADPSRFRRWPNDNDLLTQTISKPFTDGKVDIAAGEMVYGVAYQLSLFDVDGYQPMVSATSLVAGTFTSRSFDLTRETRDPIRVLNVDSTGCGIPLPTANAFGAQIVVTFNQPVAFVGSTSREDVDNSLFVVASSNTSTIYTCPLNTNLDSTVQERGSKVEVSGNTITFSWNPASAWATTVAGVSCGISPAVTSVSYGTSGLSVMPAGGDSRTESRSLLSALQDRLVTQLICPAPR
jgi:hypothetical protein